MSFRSIIILAITAFILGMIHLFGAIILVSERDKLGGINNMMLAMPWFVIGSLAGFVWHSLKSISKRLDLIESQLRKQNYLDSQIPPPR